jgi:hypothetical protein
VTEVKVLHRQAMERTDLALGARQKGEADLALAYFQEAYELESKAASLLANGVESEPTRSVLLRSAASLALDCNRIVEAERLICTALLGQPPQLIAEELRDLWEQVHFQRHLDLRGITLYEDEIQMSIAGSAVGFGIAPADAFLERVEKTETLLYRTAERQQNKPFRDRGRRDKALQQNLELYVTVPRAASFAVTFRVGKPEQQGSLFGSLGEQVIDELFSCLELFTNGDEEKLKDRIKEEAYYRNFVGLARAIAPDGEKVDLVGFTTLRRGHVKKVAMTNKRDGSRQSLPSVSTVAETSAVAVESIVQVSGTVKMADARQVGKDTIQIIGGDGRHHTIIVPPGMMSDIVKPLWDTQVVVTGVRKKWRRIELRDIRPFNPAQLEGPSSSK